MDDAHRLERSPFRFQGPFDDFARVIEAALEAESREVIYEGRRFHVISYMATVNPLNQRSYAATVQELDG
jgi:hypothetical protein